MILKVDTNIGDNFMDIIKAASSYALCNFIVILVAGIYKDVKVYDVFIDSAKEGITTVLKSHSTGGINCVGVFRASGALEFVIYAAKPIAGLFNIPSEPPCIYPSWQSPWH